MNKLILTFAAILAFLSAPSYANAMTGINISGKCQKTSIFRQNMKAFSYKRISASLSSLNISNEKERKSFYNAVLEHWVTEKTNGVHTVKYDLFVVNIVNDKESYSCPLLSGDDMIIDDMEAIFGKSVSH